MYYPPQIVYFVCSAVLAGPIFYWFYFETRDNSLSPRWLWLLCLCFGASSLMFHAVDPWGMLGIFPFLFVKFIDYLSMFLLLQCIACAAYLYLVLFFRQVKTHTPKYLKPLWLSFNVTIFTLETLSLTLACATDNLFWLGVLDSILVPVQDLLFFFIWNLNIMKIMQHLNAKSPTLLDSSMLHAALRKLRCLCVISYVFVPLLVGFSMGAFNNTWDRLARWGEKISDHQFDEQFHVVLLFSPVLKCAGLSAFLYMLRRPQTKQRHFLRVQMDSKSDTASTLERGQGGESKTQLSIASSA